VAQLFSLGSIVRPKHYIRLALVAVFQAVLTLALLCFDSDSPHWISDVLVVSALLVPFIALVLIAYDAQVFQNLPRLRKVCILVSISALFSLGGFQLWTFAGAIVRMCFRGYV
jgi:hypothetical protein